MCGIDVQMVLVVAVCVEGAVVMMLCREISTIWESLMKLNELHVGLVRHLMDKDVIDSVEKGLCGSIDGEDSEENASSDGKDNDVPASDAKEE